MEKLIQFKKEDNHYSRFIDALKTADIDYINSIECKKHFIKNWWTKYNHLAIKDSIKSHNVNIFKLIPKKLLDSVVVQFIKYFNEELFKEYSYNSSWQNICEIYLHRDTSDDIKKLCISMEGDHLNNMIPWITNKVEEKNNITDEEMEILTKSSPNMNSSQTFQLFRCQIDRNEWLGTVYLLESSRFPNNKNNSKDIVGCVDLFIKNDDTTLLEIEAKEGKMFVRNICQKQIKYISKYKSIKILRFLLKYGTDYNCLEISIRYMNKFLIENSLILYDSACFHNVYNKSYESKELYDSIVEYKKNYEIHMERLKPYLSKDLHEYAINIYYEIKIEIYSDKVYTEMEKKYGYTH